MDDPAWHSLRWARSIIDGLIQGGLTRAVISPGSRSTPLALACLRHPGLRCWVQVDERSAAFFALGLARVDGLPVMLVATSGSAPAHWYPAVIEAAASALPLVLATADRPPELQDCGAPQTIDQTHLFGSQVRGFYHLPPPAEGRAALEGAYRMGLKVASHSRTPLPGPVQLNIPFREPLVPQQQGLPEGEGFQPPPAPTAAQAASPPLAQLAGAIEGREGVILCGPDDYAAGFPQAVSHLAQLLDAPLLADPLSGLRFGPHSNQRVLTRYDAFLRRPSFTRHHSPQWVLRFGAWPVSKALGVYLEGSSHTRHYLVDAYGRYRDPLRRVEHPIQADPQDFCEGLARQLRGVTLPHWCDDFVRQEVRAAELAGMYPVLEAEVVASCIHRLPPESLIFSANSMPIRDLDSFSGRSSKPLRILANRGVSGIDGHLSTLFGLAAAWAGEGRRGQVVGLIGDLAFFHDLNGLLAGREQDSLILLFNNGGGQIFRHLPQSRLAEFEQGWRTPTGLDFAQAAALFGLAHRRVAHFGEFPLAFEQALASRGTRILELMVDSATSLASHRAYWQAVAAD